MAHKHPTFDIGRCTSIAYAHVNAAAVTGPASYPVNGRQEVFFVCFDTGGLVEICMPRVPLGLVEVEEVVPVQTRIPCRGCVRR